MRYKIVLTQQADTDLRGIYEYIAFILLEPEIAARQLERIEKAILSLDEMPERFRVSEKEPWHSRGLRQMPVDNFIVFYIPKIEDKIVAVIRVMYGGRDIDEQLKKINQ
jgi:toxin ParE1/3/4